MTMENLEELLARTERALSRHGYSIEYVKYPSNYMRRSIDVLAYNNNNNTRLFLKVSKDVRDLVSSEIRELRSISRVLDAHPLIIAERDGIQELEDIAIYERGGIHLAKPEALDHVLEKEIYVVYRQGNYFMRINGKKLREFRESKGYSLGDIALRLGISRRSIYLYEKEATDISLSIALKLLEIFGDEIFKPIDIFEESITRETRSQHKFPRDVDTEEEEKIITELSRYALKITHTRTTPVDIAAKMEENKIVIVVDHKKGDNIIEKGEEAAKIISTVNAKAYALSNRPETRKELESKGFNVLSKPSNVIATIVNDVIKDEKK